LKKLKNTLPASRVAFPIRFLRFADRQNLPKQDSFKNSQFGPFRWEKLRGQKCRSEKL